MAKPPLHTAMSILFCYWRISKIRRYLCAKKTEGANLYFDTDGGPLHQLSILSCGELAVWMLHLWCCNMAGVFRLLCVILSCSQHTMYVRASFFCYIWCRLNTKLSLADGNYRAVGLFAWSIIYWSKSPLRTLPSLEIVPKNGIRHVACRFTSGKCLMSKSNS